MGTLFRNFAGRLDRIIGLEIVRTLFYEMTSAGAVPDWTCPEGVRVERIGPEAAAALVRASGGIDSAMIEARLRSGEVCYAAYLNDKLAHYSWVKSAGVQRVLEAAAECPIRSGEFWIYHCWTENWARGRRIYPSVLVAILRDFFAAGFTKANIYTTLKNISSQKGILRVGFRETSRMRALRVGRFYCKLPT